MVKAKSKQLDPLESQVTKRETQVMSLSSSKVVVENFNPKQPCHFQSLANWVMVRVPSEFRVMVKSHQPKIESNCHF